MLVEDLSFSLHVVCIQMVVLLIFIYFVEGGVSAGDPLAPRFGNSWRTLLYSIDYSAFLHF